MQTEKTHHGEAKKLRLKHHLDDSTFSALINLKHQLQDKNKYDENEIMKSKQENKTQ